MTEQLALEQRRRRSAKVDLHERDRAARGCCGGWPRRPAPCRCRSRRRQHRSVGRRDARRDLEHGHERGSSPRIAPKSQRSSSASRLGSLARRPRGRAPREPERRPHGRSRCGVVQGLVTKSAAPAFMPSTASEIEPQAVISTTGSAGRAPGRAQEPSPPRPLVLAREVHVGEQQPGASSSSRGERVGRRPRALTGSPGCLEQQRRPRRCTDGSSSTTRTRSGAGLTRSVVPRRLDAPASRLGYPRTASARRQRRPPRAQGRPRDAAGGTREQLDHWQLEREHQPGNSANAARIRSRRGSAAGCRRSRRPSRGGDRSRAAAGHLEPQHAEQAERDHEQRGSRLPRGRHDHRREAEGLSARRAHSAAVDDPIDR